MKTNTKNLKFQIFCLTTLISCFLSFVSVSSILCISFYLTRTAEQKTLVQDNQLMLNRLAQYGRFSPDDFHSMPLGSRERVVLYEDGTRIYDSFPIRSGVQPAAVEDTLLFSECTTTFNDRVYRLESYRDISVTLRDTMALFYASLPICLFFSAGLGFIMSCFSTVLKNGLLQTASFLNHVSENSYPPSLIPCGPKELDDLYEASNHLSSEIKSSLSNYKEAIDAFIHEIKTPLTAIIGYSEILKQSENISSGDRDCVEYITTESQRLNMLTRKIIYFLSVDKQKIEWSLLDINVIMESAILSTRSRARINNISVEYKAVAGAYLYGDEELFITCLVNILENAIKASSYGSKVILHMETEQYAVSSLSIRDFGKGIPKSELPKIFQPFYMMHKGSGELDNGLGLGLAICNSIANAHHCGISVSSEVGEGTTVTLSLPVEEYRKRFAKEHPAGEEDSTLYILPSQP